MITEFYSDMDEAQKNGAISRGWLPEWLPQSTRNITEKHDLDTSRSVMIIQTTFADRDVFANHCETTKIYEPPIYFKTEYKIIKQNTDNVLLCGDQFAILGKQKIMMWRP